MKRAFARLLFPTLLVSQLGSMTLSAEAGGQPCGQTQKSAYEGVFACFNANVNFYDDNNMVLDTSPIDWVNGIEPGIPFFRGTFGAKKTDGYYLYTKKKAFFFTLPKDYAAKSDAVPHRTLRYVFQLPDSKKSLKIQCTSFKDCSENWSINGKTKGVDDPVTIMGIELTPQKAIAAIRPHLANLLKITTENYELNGKRTPGNMSDDSIDAMLFAKMLVKCRFLVKDKSLCKTINAELDEFQKFYKTEQGLTPPQIDTDAIEMDNETKPGNKFD